MKKLLYALLVLFTLCTFSLKAETGTTPHSLKQTFESKYKNLFSKKGDKEKKNKRKCECESRCQLPCLKSKCSLSIDFLTFAFNFVPLAGNFQVSIFSPNGEVVATSTIDASQIAVGGNTFTHFTVDIPAPICAGVYTVSIENENVTSGGNPLNVNPFVLFTLTNSCNTNCIQYTFPSFESIDVSFPVGCSMDAIVNILPPFVHFEKCEEHCECEKKKEG